MQGAAATSLCIVFSAAAALRGFLIADRGAKAWFHIKFDKKGKCVLVYFGIHKRNAFGLRGKLRNALRGEPWKKTWKEFIGHVII